MRREDLLARIRKCLALARSANEHEAAAALATARRLMDEHGVDEIEATTIDVGQADARGNGACTPPLWEAGLVAAVTIAIPTRAIGRSDAGWVFFGLTPAPEIAAYAFTALYRQLKRARSEYIRSALKRVRAPSRKIKRADIFCEGWTSAILNKVAQLYPQQETDPLVMAYLEHHFPARRTITARQGAIGGNAAENDRWRGFSAGRDVELNRGIGGCPTPRLAHSRPVAASG